MRRSPKKLADLFRKLGAPDPEDRAKSELEGEIPQLSRFLFVRQAWKQGVIPDGDTEWIQAFQEEAKKDPKAPLAGVGLALERLIRAGASPADLSDVVRGMQYTTLFALLYLISYPGDLEEEVKDMGWVLFEMDAAEKIGKTMECLHEDALGLDPTGREMRPR
jgi:hypothetical protein